MWALPLLVGLCGLLLTWFEAQLDEEPSGSLMALLATAWSAAVLWTEEARGLGPLAWLLGSAIPLLLLLLLALNVAVQAYRVSQREDELNVVMSGSGDCNILIEGPESRHLVALDADEAELEVALTDAQHIAWAQGLKAQLSDCRVRVAFAGGPWETLHDGLAEPQDTLNAPTRRPR